MLGGRWDLVYTTEKEVLSLIGDPGVAVYQRIDSDRGSIANSVVFGDGKRFDVTGTIDCGNGRSRAEGDFPAGLRSFFEFTGASVTIGGFTVPLPPVGKGWFVSVYLDGTLRVNRDSRGDLAIYLRA
ncbi:unnamed protein product [Prorocentrum cordatum]|uniref:Plastid lipid-associated protein/fibrillin conserved domain-containing protein n=1 Tax=Prorocentrum cordatum TaxID=2364126 RepID=A0ABN9TJL5_9DINO|nr:unnamed protein product [Polarella glacialis]